MKRSIIGFVICMLLTIPIISAVEPLDYNVIMVITTSPQSNVIENWSELQKLLASDGAAYDQFGISVSTYNDYVLIGSMGDNNYGYASGSAYIFKRTGTTWTQEAKLLPTDGSTEDYFGSSVSLYGNYALIGAPSDDVYGQGSGSAYVFKRMDTTWTQEAKLFPLDGDMDDVFGMSVSLYGDYALIGAENDEDNAQGSGSAYIFKRTDTTWTQEAKLLPLDGAAYDSFGIVSLYGDYALIGARWDDDNGENSGSAYIFKRTGTTWTQEAKLLPLDGETGDGFGKSVSLYGDHALIGAFYSEDSGAAYEFKRTDTTWTQEAKLLPLDGESYDGFGYSVSLYSDTALIGSYADDENGQNSGSTYIFRHADTTWTQEAKLLPTDGATEDYFGSSVSIYGDSALIGVPWDNDNGVVSGSAYIFIRENENHPPGKPDINGPTTVTVGEETTYTFIAIDPEGDNLYYEIDWGDGQIETWFGPFVSNVVIQKSHTWDKKGGYTIKARAKDVTGAIGEWNTLAITVPCSFNIPFAQFWIKLFERFPNAFPLLRYLMGY